MPKFHVYDPARAERLLRALRSAGIQYREKSHFIYVACPFHGGKSLGFWIHKSGRKAKCWKCEQETDWNGYADKVGLRRIDDLDDTDSGYSMRFLHQLLDGEGEGGGEELASVELPHKMRPWQTSWRRLRADFLSRLGVFRWYDDVSRYERILFPLTFQHEVVGWQAGRADPKGRYWKRDPKYRASEPFPSKYTFFGIDQVRRMRALVLVEGIYDCLRLWQNGIPAWANLGAKSVWTAEKAELVRGQTRLEMLVTAFDADADGKKATQMVKEDLGDDLRVVRVCLPKAADGDYHDVGSSPQRWIRQLRADVQDAGWDGRFRLYPLIREYDGSRFKRLR